MWRKLTSFFIQSKRVWHILKKPTFDEFKAIAKVAAIGMLILGAGGFIIGDIMKLVGEAFSA